MSMKNWSTTAASNATVDSINFAEGQAPSSLNDSARAMMADVRYELATQATVASASTTDLGANDAGSITISGTTTITGFGTVSAGIRKLVTHSGALTLTHNGTSLILPGAANITTVAGDSYIAESLGSGNWKVHSYQKATQTGSGANVNATSPTLVTPTLGDATATTINKVAITAPSASATITIANGKTLTANNSITLAGTDGTTMTFPGTSATLARTDAANTFTGHQTIEGVTSTGATGTGNLVFATSPTLTTPVIGAATGTTVALSGSVAVGGATVSAGGGAGVNFPATQSASSDANTLDDYEEGTWTPSLGGNTTYTTQGGVYRKVGSLVWIRFTIQVNAIGTGSVSGAVSGLPYASAAYGSAIRGAGLSVCWFATLAANQVYVSCGVNDSASTLQFTAISAAGTSMSAASSLFGNGTAVEVAGCYVASA